MTSTNPLAPREQRMLDALRALAPPDSCRVVVSINDIAARLGMQPGEASRAVIKLWLLRRIRGYQEPRGADPSEFEIVEDEPNTNTSEPEQPAPLSVSANANTTPESASPPALAVVPAASPAHGGRGEPKRGGRGEVPSDATLNDDDGNDGTFEANDANVEVFRCNDGTSNVNDGNVERKEHNDGNDGVGGVVVGGGSRGEESAPPSRPVVPATSPSALAASTFAPAPTASSSGLQHIGGMFPDMDAMTAPRRGSDPARDLAYECAAAMHDTDNLRAYLKLANHFPEARLRDALATVLALPQESILRPGALFTHLVKRGT